jgi:hypothetical protein
MFDYGQRATLAYWDKYVAYDESATDWLASDVFSSYGHGAAKLSRRYF